MQSALERFKHRKEVSKVVEVPFLPPTLYHNYLTNDLGDESRGIDDMSDDERADAEAKYHELTFHFRRLAPVQQRGWDLIAFKGLYDESHVEQLGRILVEQFERAEHTPKQGEPIEFTKEVFKEFCDYMSMMELISLGTAYRKALTEDLERAIAGNGLVSKQDSAMQSHTG